MDDPTKLVRTSLVDFLKTCGLQMSDDVDDVVVPYISGVVLDVDDCDLDEFVSIMEAYIPGFSCIGQDKIKHWMEKAASVTASGSPKVTREPEVEHKTEPEIHVQDERSASHDGKLAVKSKKSLRRRTDRTSSESDIYYPPTWSTVASRRKQRAISESQEDDNQWPALSPSASSSATSVADSINSQSSNYTSRDSHVETAPSELDDTVSLLTEMFPNIAIQNIKDCLDKNKHDLEQTVVGLLEDQSHHVTSSQNSKKDSNTVIRLPSGASQKKSNKKSRRKSSRNNIDQESIDESELLSPSEFKSLIINKYSFIPADLESKTYAPTISSNETKKMIRYRNGQIVSTKGERFSEVKETMSDDMKKTYVNLKPARKYRFH